MSYRPITLANASGQVMAIYRGAEKATQTFKKGVPVKIDTGMLVEGDSADPWSSADVIHGISAEAAHNLTTANTPEPATNEGTPQNQTGKTFAVGAWPKDGKVGYYRADGYNVFEISLKATQTFSQALVLASVWYTLKKDATTGFWYLDSSDTSGNNAVAEIVGPVSSDPTSVLFRFKAAQRAFN